MARTAEERRAANRIAVAKYRKSHPDQIRQRARDRMRRKRQENQLEQQNPNRQQTFRSCHLVRESIDTEKDIYPPKYRSKSSGVEGVEGDLPPGSGVSELISDMKRTIKELEAVEGQSSDADTSHSLLISLARQLLHQKDSLRITSGTQRRESAQLR
ncbi:hypothetical protein VNI00_018608 [Paramarasmius palmivorus]|uniref:BZIP domain-containing protein n=1 Tax=Paramarasmius palmivorus TaxID=297713 RepID=A0AAW0AVK8_9AGAR